MLLYIHVNFPLSTLCAVVVRTKVKSLLTVLNPPLLVSDKQQRCHNLFVAQGSYLPSHSAIQSANIVRLRAFMVLCGKNGQHFTL